MISRLVLLPEAVETQLRHIDGTNFAVLDLGSVSLNTSRNVLFNFAGNQNFLRGLIRIIVGRWCEIFRT
jgi:hypothetical protein